MATPVTCDLCEAAEAVFMLTFMPNGDTLALCWGCPPAWAESIVAATDAAAAAGEEIPPGAATAGPAPDETAGDTPEPAPPAPRKARTAKKAAKARTPRRGAKTAPAAAEGPEGGGWTVDQEGYAEPPAK